MKTFKPNKTITQLGIDTTRKFVVVKTCQTKFKQGDILTLDCDEDDNMPFFLNEKGERDWVFLSNLAYYTKEEETKEETKPLPRWVYVSDDSVENALYQKGKGQLIYELPENFLNRYICVGDGKTLESGEEIWTWKYIAEIPPEDEKVKMTLEEIEQALGKRIEIIS